MEESTSNITLVVSEREFRVNREALVDGTSYFRAMFEGHFVEAGLDRVELKDVCDLDAFSVLLDYILNKRINLESNVDWAAVLALSDMFIVDTFAEALKQEAFQKWSNFETASSISKLADALDIKVYHYDEASNNVYLWLTDFHFGSGSLEPLGIFPVLCNFQHVHVENGFPNLWPSDSTSKKICTFYNVCCDPLNEPWFSLSGMAGTKTNFISSYIRDFDGCGGSKNHVPYIEWKLNFSVTA